MSIYCVCATNRAGGVVAKPPVATIEEALAEAGIALNGGTARVWILDERGNLILPADQVKARLDPSVGTPRDFAC